jgi:DNA modification methylase
MILYQDEFVTLYQGDCLEETGWLDCDTLITDPPYGGNWNRGKLYGKGNRANGDSIRNDKTTDVRDSVLELWGNERKALVFGSMKVPRPQDTKHVLVYRKPGDSGRWGTLGGYRHDLEEIYMLGKWPAGVTGDAAASSLVTTSEVMISGKFGLTARAGHPHAKPVDLLHKLIMNIEQPGVIADPFTGSGSVLVAARELGLRAVGVELDKFWAKRCAIRLSEVPLAAGM